MSENEQRCGNCKWHKPARLHEPSDCIYPEGRLPESVVRKLHTAECGVLWTYPHLGASCPTFERKEPPA